MRFKRTTNQMSTLQHMVMNNKPSQVGNRKNNMFSSAPNLNFEDINRVRLGELIVAEQIGGMLCFGVKYSESKRTQVGLGTIGL